MATHDLSGLDAQITSWEARLAESVAAHRSALSARRDRLARQLALAEALQLGELRAEGEALLATLDEALRITTAPLGPEAAEPPIERPEMETPALPADHLVPPAEVEPEPIPIPEPEPEPEPEVAPEPEPAPVPEPKPEIALPPKRVPIKPGERRAFEKRREEFFKREDAWHEASSGLQKDFLARSLVCQVRGLIEESYRLEEDFTTLEQSLEAHRRLMDGQSFFGLNRGRIHASSLWYQLGDAYARLAEAEHVLKDLQPADLDPAKLADLVEHLGAANAYLPRLSMDQGLMFSDNDQLAQRKRIENLKLAGQFIPWWNFTNDPPPIRSLAKAAEELAPLAASIAKSAQAKTTREHAKAEIAKLIDSLESEDVDESWLEGFRAQVCRCLENGVRPTEKEFCVLLLPYEAYLEDLPTAHGTRFHKALRDLRTKLLTRNMPEGDREDPTEPDSLEFRQVKEYLAGKQVLFVGGNSQPARIRKFESELGIKLVWPSSSVDTRLESFRAPVKGADVVCLLIRFSRHAYMDTIYWAREQGKPTVILKAGMGLNRVVRDLHQQLIAKRKPEAEDA